MMSPKIKRAKVFAEVRHEGMRYGTLPYIAHLEDVYRIAKRFELPEDYLVASWLHDVLEDTDTSYDELCSLFGRKVADLVESVTGRGNNRKARKADTLEKLRKNPDGAVLKLIDRLSNVKAAAKTGRTDLLEMYRKEMPDYSELFKLGPEQARMELQKLLA